MSSIEFCPNLSFWVLLQFEFCHNLSFVTLWIVTISKLHVLSSDCHNLNFWVGSQFEFLSLVTIWVFEFCHNLSFRVLSHFEFLIWVTFHNYEKNIWSMKLQSIMTVSYTSAGKHLVCQPVQPLADKIRQELMSGCIQLGPMWCLNPTVTLHIKFSSLEILALFREVHLIADTMA